MQFFPDGLDDFRAAVVSERNVTFSWSTPTVPTPITGYNLSCSPPPSSSFLSHSFTTSGNHTVTGFHPDTSYNCSLVAYNMDSTGPTTMVMFTTSTDCELHDMQNYISHNRSDLFLQIHTFNCY